ncbi:SDR family oxidoreductase [Paenibacillus sp. FSL M7-1046]|uniref:SDR family oxidoreductase n=1 Tax=Paenibacillus sp. FSL M7-1046 TaxID=2975315 RepID=UPI0030F717D7
MLLDQLKPSGAGRIINVASSAQTKQWDIEQLSQQQRKFSSMDAYKEAKTAVLMMTYYMAKQVSDMKVTVNALHPGVIYTPQSSRTAPAFAKPLLKLFMKSPEQGAETSVHLASSPDLTNVTGTYFVGKQPTKTVTVSYDTVLQKKLYEQSLQWTGLS